LPKAFVPSVLPFFFYCAVSFVLAVSSSLDHSLILVDLGGLIMLLILKRKDGCGNISVDLSLLSIGLYGVVSHGDSVSSSKSFLSTFTFHYMR
jgi:hypothetical protein